LPSLLSFPRNLKWCSWIQPSTPPHPLTSIYPLRPAISLTRPHPKPVILKASNLKAIIRVNTIKCFAPLTEKICSIRSLQLYVSPGLWSEVGRAAASPQAYFFRRIESLHPLPASSQLGLAKGFRLTPSVPNANFMDLIRPAIPSH
jgi:hypothetical protein